MISSTLQYLIESALYLFIFLLLYKLVLSRLTYFTWMRIYLLTCLSLSLFLPLIALRLTIFGSLPESPAVGTTLNRVLFNTDMALLSHGIETLQSENSQVDLLALVWTGLLMGYFAGVLYKLIGLLKKILAIRSNFRKNHRVKRNGFWFIYLETRSPAYSFFNYIFISRQLEDLGAEGLDNICAHEGIHAKQYHTLDILFVELISIFLWFNPLIYYYKRELQEVHEYLADDEIIKNTAMKKSYSQLLLKLTSEANPPILSSAFSAKQISRRILMIGKSRSLPRHRFSFLLLLPAAAVLLISFSSVENRYKGDPSSTKGQTISDAPSSQMKIGVITWVNNTLYTDAQLNDKLGIKSGDTYSKEYLEQRLYLDIDALSSLYLDKGYLFFMAEYQEDPEQDGTMNLTITIYEGVQALIRNITIEGTGSVPIEEVRKEILIQEGELFSRAKVIKSVQAIKEMGLFDPDSMFVDPTPIEEEFDGEFAKVDIAFKLSEK